MNLSRSILIRDLIQQYLKKFKHEDRDHLVASDFPGNQVVRIKFEDGSYASFRYAIVVKGKDNLVFVFSEHCGYHVFPGNGTEISVDWIANISGSYIEACEQESIPELD